VSFVSFATHRLLRLGFFFTLRGAGAHERLLPKCVRTARAGGGPSSSEQELPTLLFDRTSSI
jgi:hypothetical protein